MGTEAETVERVGYLVAAAGATLKEKRRPIKVVGRDGAVKKTIPHVEVIEGLLHHEGISGALGHGLRPKTVLCKHCSRVVDVPANGGPIPGTCKAHRRGMTVPCVDCGKMTAAEKGRCRPCVARATGRAMAGRSDAAAKRLSKMSAEARSLAGKRGNANRDPKERSETARKRRLAQTPEQRSEQLRKSWETRRAKQAAKG